MMDTMSDKHTTLRWVAEFGASQPNSSRGAAGFCSPSSVPRPSRMQMSGVDP